MVEQLVRFCGPQSCAGGSSLLLGVVSTMSVVLVRLRTGHNRLNAHMNRRFKLAPSPTCSCGQEDQTVEPIAQRCPLIQVERQHVANCKSTDNQALWLQTRAAEVESIHHQSWSDCVAANATKKNQKKLCRIGPWEGSGNMGGEGS